MKLTSKIVKQNTNIEIIQSDSMNELKENTRLSDELTKVLKELDHKNEQNLDIDNIHITITNCDGIKTILTMNSTAVALSGGAFHDGFSDFVANEHIDWTSASDKLTTTGDANIASNLLSVGEVNGAIGIGTATPAATERLHVNLDSSHYDVMLKRYNNVYAYPLKIDNSISSRGYALYIKTKILLQLDIEQFG